MRLCYDNNLGGVDHPDPASYEPNIVGQPSQKYYALVSEALVLLEMAEDEDICYQDDMCVEAYREAILHTAIGQLRALRNLCITPR